jgi:cell wall-associated NlpC family hydrolase
VQSKGRTWQIPIPKGPRGVAMDFMLDQIEQGDQYIYGSKGPDTWDCSSLIAAGYRKAGISVYPQSGVMNRTLKHVPLSEAQPGDIFWHPGHVQLYAGRINGKRVVIEAANPRDDLRVDDSGWGKIDAVLRPTDGISA